MAPSRTQGLKTFHCNQISTFLNHMKIQFPGRKAASILGSELTDIYVYVYKYKYM